MVPLPPGQRPPAPHQAHQGHQNYQNGPPRGPPPRGYPPRPPMGGPRYSHPPPPVRQPYATEGYGHGYATPAASSATSGEGHSSAGGQQPTYGYASYPTGGYPGASAASSVAGSYDAQAAQAAQYAAQRQQGGTTAVTYGAAPVSYATPGYAAAAAPTAYSAGMILEMSLTDFRGSSVFYDLFMVCYRRIWSTVDGEESADECAVHGDSGLWHAGSLLRGKFGVLKL